VTAPAAKPPAKAATAAGAQQAAGETADKNGTACKEGCPKTVKIVITVQRLYNYHDKGMPGTLEAKIEGEEVKVKGRTTERPPGTYDLGNGKKTYPIPAKTYKAYLRKNSSRNGALPSPYKHHVVELIGVTGFAGVQIHTGQFPKHSEGCVILAATSNGDENIANFDLYGDSVPKNKELVEFVEKTQAEYKPANVEIEVVIKDPPAGAQAPALPEPKKKKK
jgi:hypothetical protein